MGRIEKTVFISYRRAYAYWPALAIFQHLTQRGYDVFFDFTGVKPGDFEQVILGNIEARAHFLVLLTPLTLDRCSQPGDWLRREIETALEMKRNVVPLMLDGFDFYAPSSREHLTGQLAALSAYQGVRIFFEYFEAAMQSLRETFLNVPLEAVLHPASPIVQQVARDHQIAAKSEPTLQQEELTPSLFRARPSSDGAR